MWGKSVPAGHQLSSTISLCVSEFQPHVSSHQVLIRGWHLKWVKICSSWFGNARKQRRTISQSPLNNLITVKAACTTSMILEEKSAFNQLWRKNNQTNHRPVKHTDFTKQLTSSPTLYSSSFLSTSIPSLLSVEARCCSALFVDNSLFKWETRIKQWYKRLNNSDTV